MVSARKVKKAVGRTLKRRKEVAKLSESLKPRCDPTHVTFRVQSLLKYWF